MVDACGIPLGTPSLAAPAKAATTLSAVVASTLDALETLGGLPEPVSVHLDRAYDSNVVRRLLEERGLEGAISTAPNGPGNRSKMR